MRSVFASTAAALLSMLLIATAAWAHGGHAPGLIGDPGAPPSNAKVIRDLAGRLVRVEVDTNDDGKMDVFNHYQDGVALRQERDTNFDGKIDLWLTLDAEGAVTQARMDDNHDGQVDLEEEYANGQVVRQQIDSNNDGRFDSHHNYTNGTPVFSQLDSNHDGRIDVWMHYNDAGNVRRIEQDTDFDGVPDITNTIGQPAPAPEPPAESTPEPTEPEDPGDVVEGEHEMDEVTVVARRPLTSASDQQVRDRDFRSFPHQNPSDLVRLIPGIHVSQHTGGAKAYQYFLRGFDAEHGQDLAAYLDGIPLNEPSQVHGHGYLDLHFLVPETLSRVRIIKGPYDPEFGNFATAGAIDFVPRRIADQNTFGATAGMYGTVRALSTFSADAEPYLFVGALETDHTEGFTDPGWADAVRANTGHTWLTQNWAFNLMSHHYAQNSAATDVIPKKWVDDGRIGRFDSIDPSDRVTGNRHIVGATFDWTSGLQEARLQGWFDYNRTTIWSNYSFYLLNPERGDQQEMRDNRSVTGVNTRYQRTDAWGATTWETAAGLQWRLDFVDQVLANATDRKRWNVINDLQFTENAFGFWLREQATLTRWLRLAPGARVDVIHYAGEGTQDERYFNIYTNMADTRQDVPRDWDETAMAFSPKASVIFTPLRDWDLFVNYGEGFFSNTSLQMANEPDSEIPKMRGGEIGTRIFFWGRRLSFAGAGWFADKETDLIFDPLTGLSSTREATERRGLDGEFRFAPINRLYLITDASYVDARFADSGDRIPNGPIVMMTNGIGYGGDLGFRGFVRGRYMGRRELDQNDWAPSYYLVDLVTGYDAETWGVELALDNVFDTEWDDAVFSYESRPEPNGATYNGIHTTPGTPFFARFTVTAKF